MRFLLLSLCLIFIGCGQGDGQGTISRPSEFKANEEKLTNSVSNQFFQVELKHFMFKTDQMESFKDLDFEKKSKFEYYELLSEYDFLRKQLSLRTDELDGRKISTHVESFSLIKRKLPKVFHHFSAYHSQDLNLREITIDLKGSLDIDQDTIKQVSGFDLVIWNQYTNTESEIATLSLNKLRKSDEYQDRYDFNLLKNLPLSVFHQLIKKSLRLLVRLEFKLEEPKTQFFYKTNKGTFIKKFVDLSSFQDFLNKDKTSLIIPSKSILHNLERANRNEHFYYFIETNKKSIESHFPFLRFKESEVSADQAIEANNQKTTIKEFEGQIIKEKWFLKSYSQNVSGVSKQPSYVGFNCSMKFQRIERNIFEPIYFEEVHKDNFQWNTLNEPRFMHGHKNFFFYLSPGEKLSIKTPQELYQKAVIGRLNKHSDCRHFDFSAFQYHQRFVYERREVTKKDVLKLQGKLREYFIPWGLIYWSEPISNIGLFTE